MTQVGRDAVHLHSPVYQNLRRAKGDEIGELKRRHDHMRARVQSVQKIEGVLGQHALYRVEDDGFAEQNVMKGHLASDDGGKGIVNENDGPARSAHFHRRGRSDLVRSEN